MRSKSITKKNNSYKILKKKNTKEIKQAVINFEEIDKITQNYNICENLEKMNNLKTRIKLSEKLFTKLNQNLNPKKENYIQYEKLKITILTLITDLFKKIPKDQNSENILNKEKLENYDFLLRENELIKEKLESILKQKENLKTQKINLRSDNEKSILVELERSTELINKREKNFKIPNSKNLMNFYDSQKEEKIQNLTSHSINQNDLKIMIKKILKEKKIFDEKNKKIMNLTLEQFLYVYLKKRYKFNNIVLGWVYSIIESLHLFCNKDLFISLFTLVLKNDFDENFIIKFEHFESLIREKCLELSGNEELTSLGKLKLDFQDCENLLKSIFSENLEDREKNIFEIKNFFENAKSILNNTKMALVINFPEFEKILKKTFLKNHDLLIKNIRNLFRKIDTKFLGFINIEQFNLIMDKIDQEGSIIKDEIRHLVDPSHLNLVTFNRFVDFFSNYKVNVFEGQKESLINIINSF